MIEDKKLGLKIADKEEAFWIKVRDETEKEINMLTDSLKFNKAVYEMAKQKLKEKNKNGK